MRYQEAQTFITNLLKTSLPSTLYYHGFHHTLDVLDAVVKIADAEKIGKDDLTLLKTAALFHDCGFINVYANHEEEGCRIARENLPKFNYDDAQIEKICGMIMATKVPQRPHNLLEKIICDADLDYLGRDDFKSTGQTLYKEWLKRGFVENEKDFNDIQIRFLKAHHYWTDTAIKWRNTLKMKHLKELENKVAV